MQELNKHTARSVIKVLFVQRQVGRSKRVEHPPAVITDAQGTYKIVNYLATTTFKVSVLTHTA